MVIDSVTNQVSVNTEALERIARNVKAIGVENIAIVSVMGAYRTGKSFLLDLFLRYLRYETSLRDELRAVARRESAEGRDVQVSSKDTEVASSRASTPTPHEAEGLSSVPKWLTAEGSIILEGHDSSAGTRGFHWRGGMEKCTQGIWLWSEPFVIQRTKKDQDGFDCVEDVAVLLLDSQGAFDSQMTKEQSATIFGLTAVLSSHQIYNVSMQLQEDKIESLHYFLECAGSCMRFLSPDKANEPKLFQHLEFLIRDWPNYEPTWDMSRCERQMKEHLAQHIESARDESTPAAIKAMFEKVTCWMLPHPGLEINKVGWNGNLKDLDPEFIRFLDAYVKRTFGPDLEERCVLGKPLTASTFVQVTESFVEAFKDLVPKGANLATAIAKSSNLMSKEQAISGFKGSVERVIGSEHSKGVSIEDFRKAEKKARSAALDMFLKSTNFGPPEDRNVVKDELVAELDKLRVYYEAENRRRMEAALTVFAGMSVLVCILYFIDKVSDFTCDWYSDTCVRMSNALFLVYFTIIVAILTNAYFLYQSRGQTVALMALIEMGKASVGLFLEYFSSLKNVIFDVKEAKYDDLRVDFLELMKRMGRDIKNGFNAIQTSVNDALFTGAGKPAE